MKVFKSAVMTINGDVCIPYKYEGKSLTDEVRLGEVQVETLLESGIVEYSLIETALSHTMCDIKIETVTGAFIFNGFISSISTCSVTKKTIMLDLVISRQGALSFSKH